MFAYSMHTRDAASHRIAVDIGGTFTDFVVETPAHRASLKLLTTPEAPERAVLQGIDRILGEMGVAAGAIASVTHGTTLATNAVIERRGAAVGFLTTEGFRDTLEMGYEYRHDQYDLLIDRTPPLVERRRRFTVRERIAADGAVLTKLDEAALPAIAVAMRAEGVEAVAIGFLHAYRNPAHEQRAAEILATLLPGVGICTSADVSPEIREYERFSTVVANAYVRKLMARYLGALREGLVARGIEAPLLLIQSNGGLCDVDIAMRHPVRLLESGPAGGAIIAAAVAEEMGIEQALLLDIGGTTAKLCFVDGFRPQMARGMEVARADRFRAHSGLPLRFPVVELCEIGAGGGSLASVDALDRLLVGPRSAGSVPGPACYGRGGTAATVTDANLVLGRLDPARFAGGSIQLDPARAEAALSRDVAAPLALGTGEAAAGVLAILTENMASAAREHAIESDRSLAGRTLIGIGGGAALHAADLAAVLGITRIVIPRDAGVGSAVGFLRAPLAFERTLSWPESLAEMDIAATAAVVRGLIGQTLADLRAAAGRAPTDAVTLLAAQMRYRGQGTELTVKLAPEDIEAEDARPRIAAAFAAAYRAMYRRALSGPMEILAWSARSEMLAPGGAPGFGPPPPEPLPTGGPARLRAALAPGETIAGPALIIDSGTTIIIPALWSARVTPGGHLDLIAEIAA